MPLTFPMPSCLHISSGNSFSFLMNTLLSFFFTNLLRPHKTLPLLLLSLTHGNNHGFFFWVKNSCRALHCHGAVAAPFYFFSFLFFFVKKNFAEALIAKTKILSETIQKIYASSTFDRMLWLKLQQW